MSDCHIVIVAHAPLADAFKACALHVFADAGPVISTIDVTPQDDVSAWLHRASEVLPQCGAPILFLTDVFGATPFNVARALCDWHAEQGGQARVLTGVNLSMLLRALTYRALPLTEMAARAHAGGVQGVALLSPRHGPSQQSSRFAYDPDQNHHHQ